ncbi:hypothetical protein CAPTEDRAFT_214448 [Capitella teleta]|uniref:UPAR/Ly6 domain-containing protein n=1 Tax=Capitella teleta TaxID=283909 RepID=R7US83_CAPTE|nr:hypothetical protein CAPTEDRAFT_214448 [Capitella teleta]|eukprot:ELU08998.1 hypothetical protein CAPTEDRAFT_214448 [Capitella teleta]
MLHSVTLSLLVTAAIFTPLVSGLMCYQCADFEVESTSGFLSIFDTRSTSPACQEGHGSNIVTCPDYGYIGHIFVYVIKLGSATLNTLVRDCIPYSGFEECLSDSDNLGPALDILKGLLSFVSQLSNVEIDGDVCYCGTDLCIPDECREGEVNIFGLVWILLLCSCRYSLDQWIVITVAVVVGGVIIIAIISCCRCCCKSSSQPGNVILPKDFVPLFPLVYQQPQVVPAQPIAVQTAGTQNPCYATPGPANPNPGCVSQSPEKY